MQIRTFVNKLEEYKYNAVNGNWNTARLIDDDLFGTYFDQPQKLANPKIQQAIQRVCHLFRIMSRQKALRWLQRQSKAPQRHLLIQHSINKMMTQKFPWVYIRHDDAAYPLVKNILWNVLNHIENLLIKPTD